MAEYDAGTVKATMTADGSELHSAVEGAKKDYRGLEDVIVGALTKVNEAERKTAQAVKETERAQQEAARKAKEAARQQEEAARKAKEGWTALSLASATAFAAIVAAALKGVDANNQLKASFEGLNSIATGNVGSYEKIKQELIKVQADGMIPLVNATNAYKNLLMRYQDEETAIKMFDKIADAAAFGRQAHLSLGQAIEGTTEGLKNSMSQMTDNGGITKNLEDMWKSYAATLGKTIGHLTDAEKKLAEVNGFMTEGRFQTGDLAKLQQQLGGQMAKTTAEINLTAAAFGDALEPSMSDANVLFQGLLKNVREMIKASPGWAAGITTVAGAFTLLLSAVSAWKVMGVTITAGFTTLMGFLATGPGLAVVAITALTAAIVGWTTAARKAREENIKLADKYRDEAVEVKGLIAEYQTLKAKIKPTADEKQRLLDITNRIAEILPESVTGWDKEKNAIIDVNKALKEMIILKSHELAMRQEEIGNEARENTSAQKKLQDKIDTEKMDLVAKSLLTDDPAELAKIKKKSDAKVAVLERQLGQLEVIHGRLERESNAITRLLNKALTPDDIKPPPKPDPGPEKPNPEVDKRSPYDIAKDQFETFAAAGASAESQLAKWTELTGTIKLSGKELDDYRKKTAELTKASEDAIQKAKDALELAKTSGPEEELLKVDQDYNQRIKGMKKGEQEYTAVTEAYQIERAKIIEKWSKETEARQYDLWASLAKAAGDAHKAELYEEMATYTRSSNNDKLSKDQKEKIETDHLAALEELGRKHNGEMEAQRLEREASILDLEGKSREAEIARENADYLRRTTSEKLTDDQIESIHNEHKKRLRDIDIKYDNEYYQAQLSLNKANVEAQIKSLGAEKEVLSLLPSTYANKLKILEVEKQIVELKIKSAQLELAELERQQAVAQNSGNTTEAKRLETEIITLKTQIAELGKGLSIEISKVTYQEFHNELADAVSSAFQDGLNGSKSFVDSFADYVKQKFIKSLADAWAESIMNSSAGQWLQSNLSVLFNMGAGAGNQQSKNAGNQNITPGTKNATPKTSTGANGADLSDVAGLKKGIDTAQPNTAGASGSGIMGAIGGAAMGAAAGGMGTGAMLGSAIGMIWGPVGSMIGGMLGGLLDSGGGGDSISVKANHGVFNADYATANFKEITLPASSLGQPIPTNATSEVKTIIVQNNIKGTVIAENDLLSMTKAAAKQGYQEAKAEEAKWHSVTTKTVTA